MTDKPEDIKNIEQRIQLLKKKQIQKDANETSGKNSAIVIAFRLGTEFVGAIFVGMGIGALIDKLFGIKVVFLLVFSLIGCIAGIRNIYYSANEIDKKINKE